MITFEISRNMNEAIASIRREVFVVEQGVSEKDEFEGGEDAFVHFCLYKDRSLVAYIRIAVKNEGLHIGRVAVKRNFRKQGLGRILMRTVEDYGLNKGCISFTLHAQLYAKGFYQRLGYLPQGVEFMEAGIKHIMMTKEMKR
jgi:cystathionine beta-lyase